MKHLIIFVPGLADKSIRKLGQAWLIARWRRRYGVGISYYHVGWADTRTSFQDKLQGLVELIEKQTRRGNTVSLVAASAGATLAIHAFAKRPDTIHRVVVICGALGPVTEVSPSILQLNPAFKEASAGVPVALDKLKAGDRRRILSIIPLSDKVVKPDFMHIDDAKHITQPTHGHALTIVTSLLKKHGKPIMDFIRQK